jgi:hypothetical protein
LDQNQHLLTGYPWDIKLQKVPEPKNKS